MLDTRCINDFESSSKVDSLENECRCGVGKGELGVDDGVEGNVMGAAKNSSLVFL
jgi:hypothetical protein